MNQAQPVHLDPRLVKFIEEWKNKKGREIMILHKVQSIYGYIPRDIAMEVSRMIDLPLAKIYGIITFYHIFKLKEPGKHQISVCTGTACYLKGANDIIQEIEEELGIGLNCTTEDGNFSVEAVRCVGCCGLAPVILIDGKAYGNLKKGDIKKILTTFEEAE